MTEWTRAAALERIKTLPKNIREDIARVIETVESGE